MNDKTGGSQLGKFKIFLPDGSTKVLDGVTEEAAKEDAKKIEGSILTRITEKHGGQVVDLN